MKKLKDVMVLAVDFDNTITIKGHWQGYSVLRPPHKNAVKMINRLASENWLIVIYTARQPTWALQNYLSRWGISYDLINKSILRYYEEAINAKVYFDCLIDDKSYQQIGRTINWRHVYWTIRWRHRKYYGGKSLIKDKIERRMERKKDGE